MAVIMDMVIQVGIMKNKINDYYSMYGLGKEIRYRINGMIKALHRTKSAYIDVDVDVDHCPLCRFDSDLYKGCRSCPWALFNNSHCSKIAYMVPNAPPLSLFYWKEIKEISRTNNYNPKNKTGVSFRVIGIKRIVTLQFWIDCAEHYKKEIERGIV